MLEAVRGRPNLGMISIDEFQLVGACLVRCLGVAARAAALLVSAHGSVGRRLDRADLSR